MSKVWWKNQEFIIIIINNMSKVWWKNQEFMGNYAAPSAVGLPAMYGELYGP